NGQRASDLPVACCLFLSSCCCDSARPTRNPDVPISFLVCLAVRFCSRLRGLLRVELALDDVEQAVERVAHRPGLLRRILERCGLLAAVAQRFAGTLAGRAELALGVEGSALVDVVARGEIALVVERGADLHGAVELLREQP